MRFQSSTTSAPVSVTTHHNKLYVGLQTPPVIEIHRTDSDMGVINRLQYGGLNIVGCIRDIAACSHCNVLYMIDYCGPADVSDDRDDEDERGGGKQPTRIHCTDDSGRIRSSWNVTSDDTLVMNEGI